jgi:site-specific recombinase XerD
LPSEPLAAFVPGFYDHLRKERGLRESTIGSYRHTLVRFATYLARLEIRSPGELSAPVLSGFVTTLARQNQGPSSMTTHCSVTRVFLRYALREGLLTRDLVPAVGTVQRYRLAKVPRLITWAEVGLMLDSVERRSSTGKRDYVLLLLLVSYGLRAREVAALTLDDIDWERDRLLVPERKAGHCTAYPLSRIVGEALCLYLEQARPRTEERILFRRAHAPYVAMTHHSVSPRAVYYLCKAGIKVHRPGSHTLRHTCVQRLIDADFSLSMSCLISRESTQC